MDHDTPQIDCNTSAYRPRTSGNATRTRMTVFGPVLLVYNGFINVISYDTRALKPARVSCPGGRRGEK